MSDRHEVVAILWEWTDGKHKGSRFWGCHGVTEDGRVQDWPKIGLRPIGASTVTVIEGDGMELLKQQ